MAGDPRGLPRLLAADEGTEAGVILLARGAADQVSLHPGDGRVGVVAGEFEVDVAVELLEALLAADLRPSRSEQPSQRLGAVVTLH